MIEDDVMVQTKYGRQPSFAVCPDGSGPFVSDLQAALEKTRTKHRLEVFPDTHHGFCFAARADYNAIAAEAAWARVFDLWERNLK